MQPDIYEMSNNEADRETETTCTTQFCYHRDILLQPSDHSFRLLGFYYLPIDLRRCLTSRLNIPESILEVVLILQRRFLFCEIKIRKKI